MFGYVTALFDFFQAKQFPVHLNPFLTANVDHPARRDPAPGADRVPVKIDAVFEFDHQMSSAALYPCNQFVFDILKPAFVRLTDDTGVFEQRYEFRL